MDKYNTLFVRRDFLYWCSEGKSVNEEEQGKRLMVTIHEYFVFLMFENSAVWGIQQHC